MMRLLLLLALEVGGVALANAGGTSLPVRCLQDKVYPCAIYAHSKTFFVHGENQYYVSAEALLELRSAHEMVLHKGVLWALQKQETSFQTVFGRIHFPSSSEGLIDVSEQQVTVSSTAGILGVKPRGESEETPVMAGVQMYLWPVDYRDHVSAASFPRVLDLKVYLKSLAQVFPYSEINFQKHIDSVAKNTVEASQQQALWNKTIVERKIAHVQEQERRRRYVSEYEKERAAYLLKRFREKNNFEE